MSIPAILQMLGNPQVGQIKNMVAMIRNAGNPQALLSQMLQNNPAYTQAMEYVKQNGGDPKAAFEKLASEKGINPSDIGL